MITDKFSTHPATDERKVDARGSENAAEKTTVSPTPAVRDDSADVGRASERLTQQARGAMHGAVDSAQQARARVAQLQLDIAREPQLVVGAFGKLTQNAFSAAIAKPSD
jgi:hypothetical protein